MEYLIELFSADLLQQFLMQLLSVSRLLISGMIFFYPLKKKNHYPQRLLVALFLCCLALIGTTWLRYHADTVGTRAFMRLVQFCMPLLVVLLTRDVNLLSKLKVLCASIGASEIGLAVFSLLLAAAGVDERETISFFGESGAYHTSLLDWLIYYGINTIVYVALFFLFRYNRYEELDKESRPATFVLTVFCLLVLVVPDCLRSEFSPDSLAYMLLYRFHLTAICVFVLIISNEIAFRSQYRAEKTVMDQVLAEERKQYQQLKENIDVVNMRCHDLKHQLEVFSGRLTEREIEELRDAMDFYDSNIKTGNEVLDVVLRLAQLTCREEGIELSCLAEGECLSFMRTRHVYSLFNNAISNAIEAVRKVKDPAKRVISVCVGKRGGRVEIEVTNYFDGLLPGAGQTSKEDKNHHGFGTMSMRYITEEYGGHFSIETQKDVFTVTAIIPLPAGEKRPIAG